MHFLSLLAVHELHGWSRQLMARITAASRFVAPSTLAEKRLLRHVSAWLCHKCIPGFRHTWPTARPAVGEFGLLDFSWTFCFCHLLVSGYPSGGSSQTSDSLRRGDLGSMMHSNRLTWVYIEKYWSSPECTQCAKFGYLYRILVSSEVYCTLI